MVVEGIILLRIQYLKKGGRGITPKIGAHLVHLIQQEHGVSASHLLHGLDNLTRQRPHIGAAMSPYLRLIPNTAQGEPNKFPPHGTRNGFGQGGLSHTGRTHETEDVTLNLSHQFLNGQILDDSLLYILKAIMVLFKDAHTLIDIDFILRVLIPRQ